MSRSTEEDLGRRRFQIEKEKAVEEAFEKIRRSYGSDWPLVASDDYDALREILGEIWIGVDRDRWKNYCFSTLSKAEIQMLIDTGKACRRRMCTAPEALARMDEMLGQCRGGS